LSESGRRFLDRRAFLQLSGSGLGAIALAALLAEQGALGAPNGGDRSPIRPNIRPDAPLAARSSHFSAKAKKVLVIFCSGALSHIDSWDYKPEVIRLHEKPMPGGEGLVTFQGEQGNLIKSLYEFKPRGQSG